MKLPKIGKRQSGGSIAAERKGSSLKQIAIGALVVWVLFSCAPVPDTPQVDTQSTVQVAIAQTETSIAQAQAVLPSATIGAVSTSTPIESRQAVGISVIPAMQTMASTISIVAPTTTPKVYGRFVVPDDGYTYMQVKHDFETEVWHNKPRAYNINGWKPDNNPKGAFPDTFPMFAAGGGRDHIRLTEPLQRLWFDLLRQASGLKIPDSVLKERWAEITSHGRALTDSYAVQQGYRDYILGQNMDAQDIQQKLLTMGGNIVRVVGSDKNNWYVEAITAAQAPSSAAELINKPWLVHWGTQSTIVELGKVYDVIDWSQLNYDGAQYGVPFMLLSPTGQLQIKKEYLKPIGNGTQYSPYDP